MRMFFSVAVIVYSLAMTLAIWHGLDLLKPFRVKYIVAVVVLLWGFSAIFGRFISSGLPLEFSAWLTRIGYVWMGLFAYILLWSAVCLILRAFGIGPATNQGRIVYFVSEISLCLVVFLSGYITAYTPVIVRQSISSDKIDNLKIVLIADNHLGYMNSAKSFGKIIQKIKEIEPDLLLIAGDFLENERNFAKIKDIGCPLREINVTHGIWAVNGNHEYYSGADEANKYVASLGIKVLRDEAVEIGDILLIGQEDPALRRLGVDPMSLDFIYSPVSDLAKEKYTIVLKHQISDHSIYENKNIDLVLSGHTHNGQLFPFNFIVAKINDIGYGFAKRGGAAFYVTSGAGVWGPPMRIGTKSEIVVFEEGIRN
ncbi:MAG: metallophosphoesterase [Candidatus Cloacimonetes bacterium]|nr:metallophosphoesterase [Candidatus Cloacimonadota bacterium]